MKNKSFGIIAAILLSAGIAFAFVNTSGQQCCPPEACNAADQTCCGMPCPADDCSIPCCEQ